MRVPSRWATIVVVAGTVLVIVFVVLSTYAIIRAFKYDQRIADERYRNTLNSCVRGSDQNDAIIHYLRDVAGGDAQDIQTARTFFPHMSRDECARTASRTVTSP